MKANIFNIQKFSLHDGPGIRTVVFFKGCPLHCQWCANPESLISHVPETAKEYKEKSMSIEEIMEEVMKDWDFYEESGGGVTLSGGEVLLQADFASQFLAQCKQNHLHTAIETSGYALPKTFQKIVKYTDLLLFDMKHHDEKKHLYYTGVSNKPILQNMKWAAANNKKITARIPVIPGVNNSLEDALAFCDLLNRIKIHEINLLPFHQFGQSKYEKLHLEYLFKDKKALHPEDLMEYAEIFRSNGFQVKI